MQRNQDGDVIVHEKLGPGEWIVTGTAMTGGGTGHGPNDVFPDGHQITCRKLLSGTDQIDWSVSTQKYYQSGAFMESVMLYYVEPLRRLG